MTMLQIEARIFRSLGGTLVTVVLDVGADSFKDSSRFQTLWQASLERAHQHVFRSLRLL